MPVSHHALQESSSWSRPHLLLPDERCHGDMLLLIKSNESTTQAAWDVSGCRTSPRHRDFLTCLSMSIEEGSNSLLPGPFYSHGN